MHERTDMVNEYRVLISRFILYTYLSNYA